MGLDSPKSKAAEMRLPEDLRPAYRDLKAFNLIQRQAA